MRVIRSAAAERIDISRTPGASALETVHRLYFDGHMDASVADTGLVAGRIDAIRPVAEIMNETGRCLGGLADDSARVDR
jgi:enoyl-[acyl-carrier protein] reductase II